MKIDHDLHIHTHLSSCCKEKTLQTPAEIILLAEEMGVSTVGFSDHIWENKAARPSDWYRPQDENNISRLRAELSEISTSIRTLVGCEADMRAPGEFSISREFASELDHVLLSCSHFHMRDFVEQPPGHEPGDIARHLLRFFRAGIKSGLASAIAHPFLPCGHVDRFDSIISEISDAEFSEAFTEAARLEVGIEITTAFLPKAAAPFSLETPVRLLSLAKEAGCLFTFGTDAHAPEQQRRLGELDYFARRLELSGKDLIPILRPRQASEPT